jgi:hypothetical protein
MKKEYLSPEFEFLKINFIADVLSDSVVIGPGGFETDPGDWFEEETTAPVENPQVPGVDETAPFLPF